MGITSEKRTSLFTLLGKKNGQACDYIPIHSLRPITFSPASPVITQWAHEQSGHGDKDEECRGCLLYTSDAADDWLVV